eukprot:TRINITY_DN12161_c1_g12_i1.p1 TRINITY_DN12161_c1_g12~~TRINITY_DN12161_c1_g12_i1.p1  ORF type:complete len:557 (+),score=122.78 TRINITY_DN12161_c1_g12_i1:297-1967(+)
MDAKAAMLASVEPEAHVSKDNVDVVEDDAADACPICLSREMEDRALADVCFHSFCFECLQAWSKVNPSCPLCKQPFNSIIHNIQSETLFDQYPIQQPIVKQPESSTEQARRWADSYSQFQPSRRTQSRARSRQRRQPRVAAAVERRQAVYAAQLRVMPEYDSRLQARLRDVAPAAMQLPEVGRRLTPWLDRELRVLVGASNVAFVANYVLSLVQKMDFRCVALVKPILEPFLGRYTEHFLHEFVHFAMSPLDMMAYDQHARYQPPADRQRRDADRYFRLVDRVLREQRQQDQDGAANSSEQPSSATDQMSSETSTSSSSRRSRSRSHGINPNGWGHSHDASANADNSNTRSSRTDSQRSRWDTPSPSPKDEHDYLEPATPPGIREMAREVLMERRKELDERLSRRQLRSPPRIDTNKAEPTVKQPDATSIAQELSQRKQELEQRRQRLLKMKMDSLHANRAFKQINLPSQAADGRGRSTSSSRCASSISVKEASSSSSKMPRIAQQSKPTSSQPASSSRGAPQAKQSKLLLLKSRMLKEASSSLQSSSSSSTTSSS